MNSPEPCGIAAITYVRQRTDSRLHWFVDLQKRLCEQECFRSIRHQLYSDLYNDEESVLVKAVVTRQRLDDAKERGADRSHLQQLDAGSTKLLVELDDYLDFWA